MRSSSATPIVSGVVATKVLSTTKDLKTSACTTSGKPPNFILDVLKKVRVTGRLEALDVLQDTSDTDGSHIETIFAEQLLLWIKLARNALG